MCALMLVAALVIGTAAPASAIKYGEDAQSLGGQVQIEVGGTFNCTGTLIKANWVITDRHCVRFDADDNLLPMSVRIGSLMLRQSDPISVAEARFPDNTDIDVALLRLSRNAGSSSLVVPWGIGETPLGSPVIVRGWGTTGLNAGRPASQLQQSEHRRGLPLLLDAARPWEMKLYSISGYVQDGDSGAGVMYKGALCGVAASSPLGGPQSTATSTDYLAAWITLTTGQGPTDSANCAEFKRKRYQLLNFGTGLVLGVGSALHNGFRGLLSDKLQGTGSQVEERGTQNDGTMPDNLHEGHDGWHIRDMLTVAPSTLRTMNPNVVNINAGLEDMMANDDPEHAPGRLEDVIDRVFDAVPDTTVVLSTLTLTTNADVEARIDQFNATLPLMVEDYQRQGRHIVLANMEGVNADDIPDGVHPDDGGYAKMASAFFDAIETALSHGWIADRTPGIGPRDLQDLRLMALGSSSTYGTGSSDGNGYREVADRGLGDLIDPGVEGHSPHVDWVGSVRVGMMDDRENEGWPGYIIDDIAGKARCAVKAYQPNLVTLIAGGNDIQKESLRPGAIDRLERLIRQVNDASPGVTVLVAGMQRFRDPTFDAAARTLTSQIPGMAQKLRQEGLKVVYADTTSLQTSDIGPDGIHPTDEGYTLIGNAFVKAAREARDARYIGQPNAAPEAASNPCGLKDDGAGGVTSKTPGTGWQDRGVIQPTNFPNESHWILDINKDGKAEFVSVDASQHFRFWWNSGPSGISGWKPMVEGESSYAPRAGAVGNALRFGDLDGDGFPDCAVINLKGGIDLYTWDAQAPSGHRMCAAHYTGTTAVLSAGSYGGDNSRPIAVGPNDKIRFADVTGGGRDDYIVIQANDATTMWANRGFQFHTLPGTDPAKPQEKERVAYLDWAPPTQIGDSLTTPRQIRYADLNGDKRADRILITAKGGARAWLNEGPQGASGTFRDIGRIAADSGLPPADIQFADMDGDGNADFLRIGHTGVTHLWLSQLTPDFFTRFHP